MIEVNKIVMKFISNFDEKLQFSIPRAKKDITGAEVEAAMLAMIDSGVILTEKGRPVSIDGADLVTTETERVA